MAVTGDAELRVTIDGEVHDVGPADMRGLALEAGGGPMPLSGSGVLRGSAAPRRVLWDRAAAAGAVARGTTRLEVVVDGWRFEATVEPAARAALRDRARRAAAAVAHAPVVVRAPIPGRIGAVRVAEGQSVAAGETLLTLEAMKMENEVRAPRAGTIGRVAVGAGQTVELGDPLMEVS